MPSLHTTSSAKVPIAICFLGESIMAPNATGDKTRPKTVIPIIEMAKILFKNFQKSGTEYNLFLNFVAIHIIKS